MLAEALPRAQRLRPAADRAADALAAAIASGGGRRIGELAEELGLVRETATRSFSRSFGVAPARFAAELRTRAAWLGITGSRRPLGQIALETGFADQAHMTRAIRAFTAQPPGRLRRGLQPATPG
jgi:transcriptional regulator GlxA family with amidase domain